MPANYKLLVQHQRAGANNNTNNKQQKHKARQKKKCVGKKCLKEAVKGCKCRRRHKFNKRRSKKRSSVSMLRERFSGIFTS